MTLLRRWKQAIEFGFGLSRHFYTISLDGFIFHLTLQVDSVKRMARNSQGQPSPPFQRVRIKQLQDKAATTGKDARRPSNRIFDSFLFCFSLSQQTKIDLTHFERTTTQSDAGAHRLELLCSTASNVINHEDDDCDQQWRTRKQDN